MKISLVVPVLNEEETIPIFYDAVRSRLSDYIVEIVFVDDGSSDTTSNLICELQKKDPLVRALCLTRNFGKEAALFAGLEHAKGDAIIPIDVDLQDPIEVIPLLIQKWQEGADVVLAKRVDRNSDGYLKCKTAEWFYRIHNLISSNKVEENVGDFRLMSRSTVDNVMKLKEHNLFMKGLLSWVGGKTEIVEYKRTKRVAGKSKFNGWKLWNFAIDGITSFSTVPLRVWTYLGSVISLASIAYGVLMILEKVIFDNDVPGYPSIIVSILFLGGIQLIGIGVLGEYLGRIYLETKRRPRYLIKKD